MEEKQKLFQKEKKRKTSKQPVNDNK